MKRFALVFPALFGCVLLFSIVPIAAQEGSVPLGPGIMTTIQPCLEYDDTHSRDDTVELLLGTKEPEQDGTNSNIRFNRAEWAKDIRFSRDITCLEFAFKPMRIVWVDFPGKNGKIERQPVWYLVYSVTNKGDSLRTTLVDQGVEFPEHTSMNVLACTCPFCTRERASQADQQVPLQESPLIRNQAGVYQPERVALPFQFAPVFIITSDAIVDNVDTTVNTRSGQITRTTSESQVSFQDQIIPLALAPIIARENPPQKLETSVSIARTPIKPGETRWGVATWIDVDPRMNNFWVDVSGLTNAYHWENQTSENGEPLMKKGEPITREILKNRRDLYRKTLRLYFWRPGDQFEQDERQFRYGGKPGEKERPYEWIYLYVNQ